MGKSKRLSTYEKGQIDALIEAGFSQQHVAEKVKRAPNTISR